MIEFKEGDKVYSYRYGIVTILGNTKFGDYPIRVKTAGEHVEGHTVDGKFHMDEKYPSIITLEKAEKMGLVRKKVNEGLRVKYQESDGWVYVTDKLFENQASFERFLRDVTFLSFVDKYLNECPPPPVEWEEIPQ